MQRLLIADSSESYAQILASYFSGDTEVRICTDGTEAASVLQSFRPDALYLNMQLPRRDGITILRESTYLPPVILATVSYIAPYIQQTAMEAGVTHMMVMPAVSAAACNLRVLLEQNAGIRSPLQEQIASHLQILGFHPHLDGYQQLRIGLPLYAQKPNSSLSKYLYPAIAAEFGSTDIHNVEHSIRNAIRAAWETGNKEAWSRYFTDNYCPSNKLFLSRLAQMLKP